MDKTTFLFDLDGTIIKSDEGILKSLNYAFEAMGMKMPELDNTKAIFGPPMRQIFTEILGVSEDVGNMAIEKYREYYDKQGMFECELYDGIKDIICDLHDSGKKVVLATSKAKFFAEKILQHFNIDKYFTYVGGTEMEGKVSTKAQIITQGLEYCGVSLSEAVMIGDRFYDINGAIEAGVESIGVLFGFGDREELTNAGATYIADTTDDLYEMVMGRKRK